MAKLTRDQKIEIYKKRKEGYSYNTLSKIYQVRASNLKHLIRLIEYHGFDVLNEGKNRVYSDKLKQTIINEVIVSKQSISSTSIKYELSSVGMLVNWLKSYKENGYTLVNNKKGRPKSMNKKPKQADKPLNQEEHIKQLEEEILYLRAQNDYLKKLRAVVEQREKRHLKKKQK